MINADILQELEFFLHSFVSGVGIMIVYDILRIFRRICRHNMMVIAMEDLLYWILCGVWIFFMLYQENSGNIRWFAVVGVASGMLLYNGTISIHFTDKVADMLLCVGKYLKAALKILFFPAGYILGKLLKCGKILGKKQRKLYVFEKKQLKKLMKRVKIVLSKY